MTQADEENTQTAAKLVESEEANPVVETHDRGGSVPSIGIMAFLAVLSVGVVLQTVVHLTSDRSDHPIIQVVIQGQMIALEEDEIPGFNDIVTQKMTREHERLASEIEDHIDDNVDALFEEAVGKVPDYVDWYFTVPASAARLYAISTGGFEDHFAQSFKKLVLDGNAFSIGMLELETQLDDNLTSGIGDMRKSVEAALLERYESYNLTEDSNDGDFDGLTMDWTSGFETSLTTLRQDQFFEFEVHAGIAPAAETSVIPPKGNQPSIAGRVLEQPEETSQSSEHRWETLSAAISRTAAAAIAVDGRSLAAESPTWPAEPMIGIFTSIGVLSGSEVVTLRSQRRTVGTSMESDIKETLLLARDDIKAELKHAYRHQVETRHHSLMDELKSRAEAARASRQFFVLGGAVR